MSGINQKEYLKKYLGIGKGTGEKKKKKKPKKTSNGFKIVDDDANINLNDEIQVDLNADNEDAPQIVSIIDDRPPSLRVDEVTHNNLWKPLGAPDIPTNTDKGLRFDGSIKLLKKLDYSPTRSNKIQHNNSSPPRRIKRENSEDNSPPRRSKTNDKDSSPPRRIKQEKCDDNSPPRRPRKHDNDPSPPRRNQRGEDNSPPRRRKERSSKKSRWADLEEPSEDKMKKTLDGKTAGLQNAKDLVLETREIKKREDELFKNMSAEISGANATTIVRGKKKDVDWEEEEKRRKKDEENKEKYQRWGKGLKQVEDVNEKMKSELHEMSKPLARYADDQDLEKYLKDQEREGDPMLAYLRTKKKKKAVHEGKPVMQEYQGDAPPNRFGIRPGYRWDGVDRSIGYEKQWFEVQNSRKANLEEIYKWSTEDM